MPKSKASTSECILVSIFTLLFIWCGITSTIQRFKCDHLTDTQLFKRIPQSFLLDFKNC